MFNSIIIFISICLIAVNCAKPSRPPDGQSSGKGPQTQPLFLPPRGGVVVPSGALTGCPCAGTLGALGGAGLFNDPLTSARLGALNYPAYSAARLQALGISPYTGLGYGGLGGYPVGQFQGLGLGYSSSNTRTGSRKIKDANRRMEAAGLASTADEEVGEIVEDMTVPAPTRRRGRKRKTQEMPDSG